MSVMRALALALFVLAAPLVGAQEPARAGRFELGLAWGRSFAGTFPAGSNDYFAGEVESDGNILAGVRLGYVATPRLTLELMAEKVSSRFVEPGAGTFSSKPQLGELDLRFVEIGARWALLTGRLVPFVGGGVGLAVLDPDIPGRVDVREANRLALHLVAGFKAYLVPWLGVRVDVRPRFVSLDNGRWFHQVDADAGLFGSF